MSYGNDRQYDHIFGKDYTVVTNSKPKTVRALQPFHLIGMRYRVCCVMLDLSDDPYPQRHIESPYLFLGRC